MVTIDRNVRKVMKLLREGNALYLNGKRITFNNNGNFIIEYTYNGQNNCIERSSIWMRNFIKNDYLNESLFLVD